MAAAVISAALLIYVFTQNATETPIAYISYLLSAYALYLVVRLCIAQIRLIWDRLLEVPLIRRLADDPDRRAFILLIGGTLFNAVYVVIKLYAGIRYQSVWMITLGCYYALLITLKAMLIRAAPRGRYGADIEREWHAYRVCGVMLLGMNLILSGIVLLSIMYNYSFEYSGNLIFAMAAYAFYAVISSALTLVKQRGGASPARSAMRAVQLCAALISLLALETALLARYGANDDPRFAKYMLAFTGGGIAVVYICVSVRMIMKAKRRNAVSRDVERKES